MKVSWLQFCILICCMVLICVSPTLADPKPVSGGIGLHIINSPGVGDFQNDVYSGFLDVSELGAWLGLQASLQISAGSHVVISPSLSAVFNRVMVEVIGADSEAEEDYTNTIIIPAVAARGFVSRGDARVYVGAEINFNIPSTQSDLVDFSSGGVGGGIFVGVNLWGNAEVEVGYEYLPVDVDIDGPLPDMVEMPDNTYDFGGVMIRGRYCF